MAKTSKSVTEQDISGLRVEAIAKGDWLQVGMCDLAMTGRFDGDNYTCLSGAEIARLTGMTTGDAENACVRAILDGQG